MVSQPQQLQDQAAPSSYRRSEQGTKIELSDSAHTKYKMLSSKHIHFKSLFFALKCTFKVEID